MSKPFIGGIIFSVAGLVMSTAGIGIKDWQLYAVLALMVCAEFLGASL